MSALAASLLVSLFSLFLEDSSVILLILLISIASPVDFNTGGLLISTPGVFFSIALFFFFSSFLIGIDFNRGLLISIGGGYSPPLMTDCITSVRNKYSL